MKDNLQTKFITRQYMISRNFEIYYYRDRKLPPVASHRHEHYEFYFFQEGDVSIRIEEQEFLLSPGDVILIPPKVRHHAVIHSTNKAYCRFVLWIAPAYYEKLTGQSPEYRYLTSSLNGEEPKDDADQKTFAAKGHFAGGRYIFHLDDAAFHSIQSRLFILMEELHANRFGQDAMLFLCLSDLLLHLNRLVYEQEHPALSSGTKNLYCELVRYIEEHLCEPLTLEQLSEAFFLSKYHIAHVFKENIGMSVGQYITKKRLQACRDAILENEDAGSACLRLGFCDYSSFFRAFKKEYGMSPRKYKTCHSSALKQRQPVTSSSMT